MVFGALKRKAFEQALTSPAVFKRLVRPFLYQLAGNDPEKVHELALEALVQHEAVIEKHVGDFDFPKLHVDIAGQKRMPFGTAAGLDKNGDALWPLSHIFGFEEPGTVVVQDRKGNDRPRVAIDKRAQDVYNAQGFPSEGLSHFIHNVSDYRNRGGDAPLLVSVCGLPPQQDKLHVAYSELNTLVERIKVYADGFVWNPFSPNTAALAALRTPEVFAKSAQLMKEWTSEGTLLLVKMGPYEPDNDARKNWLALAKAWMENGGDGIVAVNTYMTPKQFVPSKKWGYPSAGRSGRFLQNYRQRAVLDARQAFPDAFIIATGGIDSSEQAMQAFYAGANAIEGYTPYIFSGFGLVKEIAKGVEQQLLSDGYETLAAFQKERFPVLDSNKNPDSCIVA